MGTSSWQAVASDLDFEVSYLFRRVLELEGRSGDANRMVELITEVDEARQAVRREECMERPERQLEECPECHGAGVIIHDDNTGGSCPACGGSGKREVSAG